MFKILEIMPKSRDIDYYDRKKKIVGLMDERNHLSFECLDEVKSLI